MSEMLDIIRLEESFVYGTFGILRINRNIFCATLEPPNLLNKKNVSCVPVKSYTCRRRYSSKFESVTYELLNVPNRSAILFHPGNVRVDTEGCIILGQYPQKLKGPNREIVNSGMTFKSFINVMNNRPEVKLIITEYY